VRAAAPIAKGSVQHNQKRWDFRENTLARPARFQHRCGRPTQSVVLAEALRSKSVEVDTLFFPKDHEPLLNHEYQLLLAIDAGLLAFDRSLAFLDAHAR